MVFVVALTGGIGSGKSTITRLFRKPGVTIIDADEISRQVVQPGTIALKKIVEHFGKQILLADSSLDRAQLRTIIFNNTQQRLWLNQLLHPLINDETKKQINQVTMGYILWVVPLLFENELQYSVDRILVIDVDPELQVERICKRDNIDENLAKKMLSSQLLNNERLSYADDIIINNTNPETLISNVERLHEQYLTLAAKKSQSKKDYGEFIRKSNI